MIDDSSPAAVALVERFLACMDAKDLAGASALLAAGFTMTFPGPNGFRSLDAFAVWGKGRYRSARSRVDRFDVARDGEDAVVYAVGAVSGTFGDGTDFEDVRFVDRFVVRHGAIVRMDAWSDIADVRLRALRDAAGAA
jgi:hypothetical protein